MRYFMFSPLDMSMDEAFKTVERLLDTQYIIRVRGSGEYQTVNYIPITPGERPRALPQTYLVRVESDGSLRVVHTALS